ncbi:MAG: glycosyltransferase [Bacteroidales bacterium]|jgi:glycosyltransferase involved in cell wall biosynthesis|nr:glycosyltransferase [Bacteroidales bacterium]
MYILHLPSWFPDAENPYKGNFIEKHIDAISDFYPCITLQVVGIEKVTRKCATEEKDNNIIIRYFYKKSHNLFRKAYNKFYKEYLYHKGAEKIVAQYGKPELIHLHVAFPVGKTACRWSEKWGIPLVLTEHWSIYQEKNRDKLAPALDKKLRKIWRNVQAFTTVSQDLKQQIERLYETKYGFVIHNVVNTNLFCPFTPNHDKKTIIHISTLQDEVKNFTGILQAIDMLHQKRNDFVLKVIYEQPNAAAEQYVKDHHLSAIVQFLGSKPEVEVAQELQNSDFLVLFSNYENLPCVICEAFSCGKPVVVTPVGGIPEIVNTDRGLFAQVKDIEDLALQLNTMLDHYNDYNSFNIRTFSEKHFSRKKIGKEFSEFYKFLVSLHP